MTLKRYDNSVYRAARDSLPEHIGDPELGTLAGRLIRFLEAEGWLAKARATLPWSGMMPETTAARLQQ